MSEIEQLSDDDLERELTRAVEEGPDYEFEHTDAPSEEPAAEEAVTEPEATEEAPASDDTEQEVAEEAQPEPATEEAEAGTAGEQVDLEKEELRASYAEMEARAKKWEQVAGRHGGRLGFLESQIQQIRQTGQQRVPPQPDVDGEYEQPQPPPAPPPQQQHPDQMTAWAIGQGIKDGMAEFSAQHPEGQEHHQQMGEYLQSIGWDASKVLESNDPITAQTETRRALEEAYWHVMAESRAARKAELVQQRVDQTAKLKQAKQRAAPSATASAPPPKPRTKTTDELSDDELENELETEAGKAGRWY